MRKRDYLIEARGNKLQKDVAVKCGVSPQVYCMIENGHRHGCMSVDMMKKISNALGVPFNKLVKAEMSYILTRGER